MTSGTPKIPSTSTRPTIYPNYCHDLSPTLLKWCPLRAEDIHALKDVGMFLDDLRLYHYDNHPVKWVKVVGVVVSIEDFFSRKVYTVDDGSGACIECSCIAPAPPPAALAGPGMPSHLDQADRPLVVISGVAARSGLGRMDVKAAEQAKAKLEGFNDKSEAEKPEGVKNPRVPWDEVDVGTVVKVKGRVGAFRDIKQVEIVRVEVTRATVDAEVKFWDEALRFKREVLSKPWDVSPEQQERFRRKREKQKRSVRRGQMTAKGTSRDQKHFQSRGMDGNRDDKSDRRGDAARRMLEEERESRQANEGKLTRSEGNRMGDSEERSSRPKSNSGGARFNERDRINYPSLAVRRAAAGKYAALGI